jgi:sensor histidine kinase YesM
MSIAAPPYDNHILHHPLEAVPWLRRIPKSLTRDLLFTLLLAAFSTALFSFISLLNVPTESLSHLIKVSAVFSLCIGYAMHAVSVAVDRILLKWFNPHSHGQRLLAGLFAAALGCVVGYLVAASLLGLGIRLWSGMFISMVWAAMVIAGLGITHRRATVRELAYERERSARIEAERLVIVSRLQTLQAQIEPHFLFNTLANVSSLIETEPKQARKMLDQFTLLLRASLDQTRKATTTLRAELQVIDAYLSVLKVRMGERLSYRIDAPSELLGIEVPSMFLQPVVENAVKHGIEPRMTGGVVQVEVKREGQSLMFVVIDDGVGFVAASKENIGLGAVRERLAVQYGDAASLNIERTADNLTRVAIRIPFPSATS